MANEPVERIYVRIRGLNNIVAVVCCKHPDKEEADKSLFQQLELASSLQGLILTGGSTHPISAGRATQQGRAIPRDFNTVSNNILTNKVVTRQGGQTLQ